MPLQANKLTGGTKFCSFRPYIPKFRPIWDKFGSTLLPA